MHCETIRDEVDDGVWITIVTGTGRAFCTGAGVRERLSAFKVPTCWVVTDSAGDVAMTATAKVDKPALQDLLTRKGTAP